MSAAPSHPAGFRRPDGSPLRLDRRPLAAGGEARIFAVTGAPARVAKVLHNPTEAHAAKVAWMIAHPPRGVPVPDGVHVAWPSEALYDDEGRFAGFVMARARGLRLFELFNPAARRARAPEADYAVLHRAGRNLAAAFEALHGHGCVLGDVNESNVLVDPAGAVTLVDADSFQVADAESGAVHRSRVGKPEYTPPELQGCTFAEVDRGPEHDRFGLAVLLFQLLMEGTHPFAGRYPRGTETPPVGERISAGHFPYAGRADPPSRPPRLAPPFGTLHPRLQALFLLTFVHGHVDPAVRPTAAEWRDAMAEAEAALVVCDDEPRHRFGTHLGACPWCARVRRLGVRDPWGGAAASPPAVRGTTSPAPAPATPAPATGVSILPPGAPAADRLANALGLKGPANQWMLWAPACALLSVWGGGAPLALGALFCTLRGWDVAGRTPSTEHGPLRASVLLTMLLLVIGMLAGIGPGGGMRAEDDERWSEVTVEPLSSETSAPTVLNPDEVLEEAWRLRPAVVAERGVSLQAEGHAVLDGDGWVERPPGLALRALDGGEITSAEWGDVRDAADGVADAMRFTSAGRRGIVRFAVRWHPDRVELEMLDQATVFTRSTPAGVPEPAPDAGAGEEAPAVLSADLALDAAVRHARELAPERGDPFEATAAVQVGGGHARPETLALQRVGWSSRTATVHQRRRVEAALRDVATRLQFQPAEKDGRVRFTVRWHPDRVEVLVPSSGARFVRSVGGRTEPGRIGAGAAEAGSDAAVHDLWSVDRRPQLADPARMRAAMERNAPRFLREEGRSARMVASFVVDRVGTVVPSSIELDDVEIDLGRTGGAASDAGEREEMRAQAERAARRTLRELRFDPARVRGSPVRVYVTLPLEWRG